MRQRLICPVMFVAAVMPAFGTPFSLSTNDSSFGLLGGTISNTGNSVVVGNVGATTTITGFPPGTATGTVYPYPSDPTVEAAYTAFESDYSTALGLTPSAERLVGEPKFSREARGITCTHPRAPSRRPQAASL